LERLIYKNCILQFIKFSVAEIELVTCHCSWGHILTPTEMMTPLTVFTSGVKYDNP
jgi:hypothetical protein